MTPYGFDLVGLEMSEIDHFLLQHRSKLVSEPGKIKPVWPSTVSVME